MNLQKSELNTSDVNHVANRFTTVLFGIYLVALCWILLFKLGVKFSYMESRRVNLVPFSAPFLKGEMILNVLIFIPLGIYAGVLFERWSVGRKVLFFFVTSFLVEALQFTLAIGAFDSTDILTNGLGGVIGLMLYELIRKAFNNRGNAQKFINIIAATGTIVMVVLLLLLKMNMLPIRYR